MNEKLFVTYEQFGAVGDGRTDDYAAFQAALGSGAERVTVPMQYRLIKR